MKERIALVLVIILVLYLTWRTVEPFVSSIFFAFVTAYAVYPIQKRLETKLGRKTSAIFLTTLLVGGGGFLTLKLLIISAKVGTSIVKDAGEFLSWLLNQPIPPEILRVIQNSRGTIVDRIAEVMAKEAVSLPYYTLQLLIFLVVFYYTLSNWNYIGLKIRELLPRERRELAEEILDSADKTLSALVRAWLLLNVVKSLLMTLGFLLFRVSDVYIAVVAGFLTFLFSFVPLFEGWMIWLAAAIYFVYHGLYLRALGIALYGFLLVSPTPDYTVRPLLVARDAKLDETLVFLGMVGGTWAMGLKGLIIGPIVLNLFLVMIHEWKRYLKRN